MKYVCILLLLLICVTSGFSIIEVNEYRDLQLTEKLGTYDEPTFGRLSSFSFYGGAGTGGYGEVGGFLRLHIAIPELQGLFIHTTLFTNWVADRKDIGGEFAKINDIFIYFNEAVIGYRNKYTTLQIGFQKLVSSDAIYHNLIVDDYSGPIFSLKWNLWLSRFVDAELMYAIIRPHQSDWVTSYPSESPWQYHGLYGKSLFIKKLNFRPLPWIRFGLTDSVYLMGENFNIWYINPFSLYFFTQGSTPYNQQKSGGKMNTGASDIKFGADFNIGFSGWRCYGQVLFDDMDAAFIRFADEIFPARLGFVIGGEIRGYLITSRVGMPDAAAFILGNMYLNMEYAIVSKYTYTRDHVHHYEYVREEYPNDYDPSQPISQETIDYINRPGNMLGYMYGNNADSFDIALGWRNDLTDVKQYRAEYQGDVYFSSFKKKKVVPRFFKLQLHYRHYRLGDERNVIMPYYGNEHYYYDVDPDLDSDGDGDPANDTTNRHTEFLRNVVESGNIFDIDVYSDIFTFSRFVLGAEMSFRFFWQTMYPRTPIASTTFNFRWNFAITVSW